MSSLETVPFFGVFFIMFEYFARKDFRYISDSSVKLQKGSVV